LENQKKQSALATLYNTLRLDGNSCLFFFLIVFIQAADARVENRCACLDFQIVVVDLRAIGKQGSEQSNLPLLSHDSHKARK